MIKMAPREAKKKNPTKPKSKPHTNSSITVVLYIATFDKYSASSGPDVTAKPELHSEMTRLYT